LDGIVRGMSLAVPVRDLIFDTCCEQRPTGSKSYFLSVTWSCCCRLAEWSSNLIHLSQGLPDWIGLSLLFRSRVIDLSWRHRSFHQGPSAFEVSKIQGLNWTHMPPHYVWVRPCFWKLFLWTLDLSWWSCLYFLDLLEVSFVLLRHRIGEDYWYCFIKTLKLEHFILKTIIWPWLLWLMLCVWNM
jgi:hypothetical protein